MANSPEAWRALTGLNYHDSKGKDRRAEAGDKITDIADNDLRHETEAGNVEEWVEGHTENVRKERTGDPLPISGVLVEEERDEDGYLVMKGVDER